MKKSEIITAVLALLILGSVGIYTLLEKRKTQDKEQQPYTATINGEEVTLEHPYIPSFSNVDSNKSLEGENKNPQATAQQSLVQSVTRTVKNTVKAEIQQPFILGVYYLDTLLNKGVEKCTAKHGLLEDDETSRDYSKDNFKLSDVLFSNDAAYLFVDAKDIPEDTCAHMVMFPDMKPNFFSGIHVFIK